MIRKQARETGTTVKLACYIYDSRLNLGGPRSFSPNSDIFAYILKEYDVFGLL